MASPSRQQQPPSEGQQPGRSSPVPNSTSTPRANAPPPISLPAVSARLSPSTAGPGSPRASALKLPPGSPLASTSQAALGRGRPAPAAAQGSHGRTLSFVTPADPSTGGTRSASRMRQTSYGASVTDSEELLSAGEDDDRTRPLRKSYSTMAQPRARSASIQPGKAAGKARSPGDGSDEAEDDAGPVLPRMSLHASLMKRPMARNVAPDEDDEVERKDRGEELIKRRMRERKRATKEKEKQERIKQEEQLRRDQERQQKRDRRSIKSSARPQLAIDSQDGGILSEAEYESSAGPMLRRDTAGSLRVASAVSQPGTVEPDSAYPRDGLQDWQSQDLEELRSNVSSALPTTTLAKPPPTLQRVPSSSGPSGKPDVFSDNEGEGTPSLATNAGAQRSESATRGSNAGDQDDQSQSSRVRIEEIPEEDEEEEEEAEDEDIDPNDVEYTLKDRQDAINAEHPFGLPIWKPALYKKSRSVTRNAENALHLAPSAAAEQHLLPGNIIWALLFGSVMCLICIIIAAILWLIPFGGSKYGRVLWELGVYLLWPFGRYVETMDVDNEAKEVAALDGYDELESSDDDLQEGSYEEDGAESGDQAWPRRNHSLALSTTETVTPEDRSPLRDSQRTIKTRDYGTMANGGPSSSGSETAVTDASPPRKIEDESQMLLPGEHQDPRKHIRVRALGRLSYWVLFYLIIAPLMLLVCLMCWAFVFTIPMAKLNWVLFRHLMKEPLMLHFRSPPTYHPSKEALSDGSAPSAPPKLKPGYRAPKRSRRHYEADRAGGRLVGQQGKILLCTYRAMGMQYYKYTIDGTNILFINLMPLVLFVIFSFFALRPGEGQPPLPGLLAFVTSDGFLFVTSLLSVIPLSYFIGMAVASISAQSSIGMGSVINATFGSVIEILLYSFALIEGKADLVEGSIVGSLLAGVLLMPGLSMIGGAVRRKEQRFNAKSAGITSTLLIMAIIGVLTPTLFYETYGTFQLSCSGCPEESGDAFKCDRCVYQHISPTDDPFYQGVVKNLSYYCAIILVASYVVGLWFSLRTHASQIWQNAQSHPQTAPNTAALPESVGRMRSRDTSTRMEPAVRHGDLPPSERPTSWSALPTPAINGGFPFFQRRASTAMSDVGKSSDDPNAIHVNASLGQILDWGRQIKSETERRTLEHLHLPPPSATAPLRRSESRMSVGHGRDASRMGPHQPVEQSGGHDAPNWSRSKSASVLLVCTLLYAAIAEILVDVVDVVLQGSDIPEKFLGVTLFALVPNTTEFMNAISFAINGNIALSMEIGSAYAIQVCLLQIPAMVAFTSWYSVGKTSMLHRAFTLVFPRWDVIAILFSVFLLTYTYIEARANYFRGTTLCLSYLALLGGFYAAPGGIDNESDPILLQSAGSALTMLRASFLGLWSH